MKSRKKRGLLITVLIIAIIIIILLIALFLHFFVFSGNDTENQSASSSEASVTETYTTTEWTNEKGEFTYAEEPDMDAIDFDELNVINDEIYAWIYVPNTNVDYPVAQPYKSGDDFYYFEHNIYKEYQFSGTICSETHNTRTFDDPVTVLYGHNMINGTMFASLHQFEDPDFFNDNNTIFVFTKDKLITYLIYSAFDYDDRHIMNSFHFNLEEDFKSFVNDTINPRSIVYNVRPDVTINDDDKLLVLSTCSNHSYTSRFLVMGVKVRERIRK